MNWFSWISTREKAEAAEHQLLSRLEFFESHLPEISKPDPEQETVARIEKVKLNDDHFINTLVIDSKKEPRKKVLVMAHGYGAGLGFFFKAYQGLSNLRGYKILSIDWLGMGNSSRPDFPTRKRGETEDEHLDKVEDFFVNSLEQFRIVNKIEKMTLMGHSMGGYFCSLYSLKYPQAVEKLILVSPAGLPERPADLKPNELRPGRVMPNWAVSLWEKNFTPMYIIRLSGPFGPGLVNRYVSRRFSYFNELDSKHFNEYLFHISAQKGSGEYALGSLLLPGAWAKRPLIKRLENLRVPTCFMYGQQDWMDINAATSLAQKLTVKCTVKEIENAGHHIYMDNPQGFIDFVTEILQ